MNLFAYGSFMFPPVLNKILFKNKPRSLAVLQGYSRLAIENRYDPALISEPNSAIEGCVYFQLTGRDFKLLDEHEGSEYSRILLPIQLKGEGGSNRQFVRSYVYFLHTPSQPVDVNMSDDWCPEHFSQNSLPRFLCKETSRTELVKRRYR